MRQYISTLFSTPTLIIGKIEVGRFETSQFWSSESAASSVPRFTVFVLDVAMTAVRTCAVFMVGMFNGAFYSINMCLIHSNTVGSNSYLLISRFLRGVNQTSNSVPKKDCSRLPLRPPVVDSLQCECIFS